MTNVIVTPQTWVIASLIGGKEVVNSRWWITLYDIYIIRIRICISDIE